MIFKDVSNLYELLLPYSEKPCKECGRVRLFQYRNLESFIHPLYKDRRDIKYVDRFLSTALSDEQFLELASMVKDNKIALATTPFDEKSVSLALRADVDVLKIVLSFFIVLLFFYYFTDTKIIEYAIINLLIIPSSVYLLLVIILYFKLLKKGE